MLSVLYRLQSWRCSRFSPDSEKWTRSSCSTRDPDSRPSCKCQMYTQLWLHMRLRICRLVSLDDVESRAHPASRTKCIFQSQIQISKFPIIGPKGTHRRKADDVKYICGSHDNAWPSTTGAQDARSQFSCLGIEGGIDCEPQVSSRPRNVHPLPLLFSR